MVTYGGMSREEIEAFMKLYDIIVTKETLDLIVGSMSPIAHTANFIEFIFEEALQTASMGLWQLIRAKRYDSARYVLIDMAKIWDVAKEVHDSIGLFNLAGRKAFGANLEAVRIQMDAYTDLLIHAGSTPGKEFPQPGKATLILDSIPDYARIDIDGVYIHHLTPETLKVDPGKHTFRIYKKGFEDETGIVDLKEGEVKEITLTLYKTGERPLPPPTPREKIDGKIWGMAAAQTRSDAHRKVWVQVENTGTVDHDFLLHVYWEDTKRPIINTRPGILEKGKKVEYWSFYPLRIGSYWMVAELRDGGKVLDTHRLKVTIT